MCGKHPKLRYGKNNDNNDNNNFKVSYAVDLCEIIVVIVSLHQNKIQLILGTKSHDV